MTKRQASRKAASVAKPGRPRIRFQFEDGTSESMDLLEHDIIIHEQNAELRRLQEHETLIRSTVADEQHAELSARNRVNAKQQRKSVTQQNILAFRAKFAQKHGTVRGWKKAACLHFDISDKTLADRLSNNLPE